MKEKEQQKTRFKTLNVEYFKYRTLLTRKFENRKTYQEKDPRLVTAFIPGTIRKVRVKPGDRIKKGDLLLTLEAMKMKNRILSPLDGTIREVKVESGMNVAKNAVLVAFE